MDATAISAFADSITAFATLIAALIAIRGIQSWRAQLKSSFDLTEGKALLAAIRKLDAGVHVARDVMFYQGEDKEQRPAAIAKPWSEFINASEHLTLFWGDDFKEKVENLNEIINKYFQSLSAIKTLSDQNGKPYPNHIENHGRFFDNVYGNFDSDDIFGKEIMSRINDVRGLVVKRLEPIMGFENSE